MPKPTNVKFPFIDNCKWEEIPQEDLWDDGELDSEQVKEKLYQEVIRQGVWKLIRRINE